MQASWDTIDPKLLHWNPVAVGVQNNAHDAGAHLIVHGSDLAHVDEEAVDAQAFDRRDSDSLAILGLFEFDYASQDLHRFENQAYPSLLEGPVGSGQSPHLEQDHASHLRFDEPWNHLHVTNSDALPPGDTDWGRIPTTRPRKKSETVVVSPLFLAAELPSQEEVGSTQWLRHSQGGPSILRTQLENAGVSHQSWYALRPQITTQGWVPVQHQLPNDIYTNISPQTFANPFTPPQESFSRLEQPLTASNVPGYIRCDNQTPLGHFPLPSPQYSSSSIRVRDEYYRLSLTGSQDQGKHEYLPTPLAQQGEAQYTTYPQRLLSDSVQQPVSNEVSALAPSASERLLTEPRWIEVNEENNAAIVPIVGAEESFQHSQPIPIHGSRRSHTPLLRKPGYRGRCSSASDVHLCLNFIREDGRGAVHRGELAQRGIRHGPLPKEQAREAAIIRKEQKVCMKCREDRIKCTGGAPCQRCYKLELRGTLKAPCLKAQFLEIIQSGSCNYISQRAINHRTIDGTRRVQMFLPETFKLGKLLSLLETRQNKFRIKARSQVGSLYTLDLRKCYQFLAKMCGNEAAHEFDLRDFIDNKLLSTSEWFDCVSDFDRENSIVGLLAQWNNMPSRATFSFEPLDGSPIRDMDVEDPHDQDEILIAAQLSRIICRKAEIDGYNALQSAINQTRQKSSTEVQRSVYELGQLLVTLRWRISWWELLGDGSNKDDIFRDRFVERVRHLSKVLYFYYCSMMRRLASFTDARAQLRGMPSTYADAAPFFDDFPVDDSISGFESWMERGKDLVRLAGVAQRLSQYQSLEVKVL